MQSAGACAALVLVALASSGCFKGPCATTASWSEPGLVDWLRQHEVAVPEGPSDPNGTAGWNRTEPRGLPMTGPGAHAPLPGKAVLTEARRQDKPRHLGLAIDGDGAYVQSLEDHAIEPWPIPTRDVLALLNESLRPVFAGDQATFEAALARVADRRPATGPVDLRGPWDFGGALPANASFSPALDPEFGAGVGAFVAQQGGWTFTAQVATWRHDPGCPLLGEFEAPSKECQDRLSVDALGTAVAYFVHGPASVDEAQRRIRDREPAVAWTFEHLSLREGHCWGII